jgi:acetyl/propionyl-CoA carboxylase alpha subunit/acetyl-CoA carboxylase carboxyltransferase component
VALTRVLVANRGEIALRVVRACMSLGIESVTVFARDDATSGHVDERSWPLPGNGPTAYLDIDALLDVARRSGCDAVHPGYGFLSESAEFAEACAAAGLAFVGPSPATLRAFGDKVAARRAAAEACVPVLRATEGDTSVAEAEAFFDDVGPVMVKAVGGGGGRGQRAVFRREEIGDALSRCRSEAARFFSSGAVYVEQLFAGARHIEVQLLGDSKHVVALGDRDCTVQRARQKLIELAPAPALTGNVRRAVAEAAVRLGARAGLCGLATMEFLVSSDTYVFLESNPRVQVEHTVTEEAFGIDLVASQLRVAGGATLTELGLATAPEALRSAIQLRLNAERITPEGRVQPTTGTVTSVTWPDGVRVDTNIRPGLQVAGTFDTLLAKVIVSGPLDDTAALIAAARAALDGLYVVGIETNQQLLGALLARTELAAGAMTTTFVDEHLAELVGPGPESAPRVAAVTDGAVQVIAPLSGVVVAVEAEPDAPVRRGATLVVLESMKMEHVVVAPAAGRLSEILVAVGDQVAEGQPVAHFIADTDEVATDDGGQGAIDLDAIRPELAELRTRLGYTLDENRPGPVAKRRALGRRTTRENLAQLCDEGTFVEYGALTVAAQRQRRDLRDLLENTPADGVICGIGRVDGVRCVVVAYDYTVLAGTQGMYGHRKQARIFDLAAREHLPVVLYAEGGGGRPGDVDTGWIAALDDPTFTLLARLSGTVPIVAVVSGRSFAGNAALAGCADVIIATPEVSIGMGGPAMIEGGGLGVVHPDKVGPLSVQVPNGVVDIVAADETEATDLVRRLVCQFVGIRKEWTVADQRLLRHLVPQNRSRAYDVRPIIEALADVGSVVELRPEFGVGIRTSLARIEGRSVGIVANNSLHLGGAIDAPAADKLARFLQLCDAHGMPVVSLCDTPGFMVGPEAEKTATVRHFSRVFVAGANLRVPLCFVALRKAYGLGAMAMAGGHLHAAVAAYAWPTGEFGGMGLEGGVRLGYRRELEATADPQERQRLFDQLVGQAYERGKAINIATIYEIDGVIDPADTRALILGVLGDVGPAPRRFFVDTW